MSIHDDLPTFVTLPIPLPDPRPRGIHSLGVMSTAFSIRFDAPTMDKLREQSKQLGITPGEYARWCTTKMVEAIEVHTEKISDLPNTENGKER